MPCIGCCSTCILAITRLRQTRQTLAFNGGVRYDTLLFVSCGAMRPLQQFIYDVFRIDRCDLLIVFLMHFIENDAITIHKHIPVYTLAQKYQINGLMQYCAKKFKYEASVNWDREWFEDLLLDVFGVHCGIGSLLPPGKENLMKDTVIELALEHAEDLKRDFWLPGLFRKYPEFHHRYTQRRTSWLEEQDHATSESSVMEE